MLQLNDQTGAMWTDVVGIHRWQHYGQQTGTYAVVLLMDVLAAAVFGGAKGPFHCAAVMDDFGCLVRVGELQ